MAIESFNPATEEKIRSYRALTKSEIAEKLQKSRGAFEEWRLLGVDQRASFMKKAADRLLSDKDRYAALMALEMGKPFSQGKKEAEKCASVCEYYAKNAESFLKPETIQTEASKSYVAFEPMGAVLAVMPWNFPFWQVFRAAAPALMAGNVMALKHAANVQGCAEAIEKVFLEAGFPEGVFSNFTIESSQAGDLIESPLVDAVTLTGSVAAGKAVAQKAGSHLKKTVMELGGSDPYIVLKDADLGQAVQACGESRLINSGQSCIAAKRFIVEQEIYSAFVEKLTDYLKTQKMGDPMEEGVTIGPMARRDLRDEIHRQVERSVRKGAKLLLGGRVPDQRGYFYPPTVLADVKKGMPAYEEEIFGPVASIIQVRSEKEAVEAANDTVFGLGAAVFTRDVEKGEEIARKQLNAGAAFVNAYVRSDPRLPFGGIGASGYGRELGCFGIREFVNIKTVYVQ